MATTTTYQCPNCNGRLSFDSSVGKLRCEFCESLFTPEEVERLFADKQAKADASALSASKRALKAAAAAGIDVSAMDDRQKHALSEAYERAVSEGKSQDEVAEAMRQAAAVPGAAGGQAAATSSAAAASAAEAARLKPTNVQLTGDPIKDYLAQAKQNSADMDTLRAFNCPACGAQLMVDQVTAVTSCPYCGNNAVVPGQLSDVLKPDYVIPFKVDRDAAIAALSNYYGGKKLLPNSFTEGNHIEEVQGVYVPFWLYTGEAEGDFTFNATKSRSWTDTRNMYTETDHYQLLRVGSMSFKRVPVDGSTKMPDAHMDAIEPYDYSELVPFSVAYLPGFLTDRYDLDVSQCDSRARNRVEATCAAAIESQVGGYETVATERGAVKVNWSNVAYALLPVWMLHTKWNDEDYLFAMNGQTGKLIGDLPIDPGKVRMHFLAMFLPIMIVIALLIVFVFGGFSV